MKTTKIIFWATTSLLALTQGLMPIILHLTSPEVAEKGYAELGYPLYFGFMLDAFKFFGGLTLMIPCVPKNMKEWAYAGFGIDFIAAFVSVIVMTGNIPHSIFPIIAFCFLATSYISYKKLCKIKCTQSC